MDGAIHVGFLSQDSGFAEVVGRALGDGFVCQTSTELQLSRLTEIREWCDVLLFDLRLASTGEDQEPLLGLMGEMSKFPSQPPMIALCDAENRALLTDRLRRD